MLKQIISAASLAVITSVLMAAGSTAFGQTMPYSVEMKITATVDKVTKVDNVKVYLVSGTKYRIEQSSGASKRVIVVNGRDTYRAEYPRMVGVHLLQPMEAYVKLQKLGPQTSNSLTTFIKSGGKLKGTEVIDGVKCELYSFVGKDTQNHKLWVALPNRYAKRMMEDGVVKGALQMGAPQETHIVSRVTEFSNWQTGKTLDAKLFVPPSDVKYEEAPKEIIAKPQFPVVRPKISK